MTNKLTNIGLTLVALTSGVHAMASTYPVTVTDIAGRTVSLPREPKRIVIQDGRDILALALLDRSNPFARVVGWNNVLGKNDPGAWKVLLSKWPAAGKIADISFSSDGQVGMEQLIAQKPELMIAKLRFRKLFQATGVMDKLAQLQIPVIFVDHEEDPIEHTTASIILLGKVLNRENEAAQYATFYQQHLKAVQQAVARQKVRPSVFVEALAGKSGLDTCCFTHGKKGWGDLIEAAGGRNLGAQLLPSPTGNVAMEKLLALQPDVYLMTGSGWTNKQSAAIPMGYGSTDAKVKASFGPLLKRTGFAQLKAYKTDRVYAIYHQFADHPFNIVAVEHLAKDFYPEGFMALDPNNTYQQIIRQFTRIPAVPVITGAPVTKQ